MYSSEFSATIDSVDAQIRQIDKAAEELHQLQFDTTSKLLALREHIVDKWRKTPRSPRGSTYVEDTGQGGTYYGAWVKAPDPDIKSYSLLLGFGREAYVFYDLTPTDQIDIDGYHGKLLNTMKLADCSDIPCMRPRQIRDLLTIAQYFRDV